MAYARPLYVYKLASVRHRPPSCILTRPCVLRKGLGPDERILAGPRKDGAWPVTRKMIWCGGAEGLVKSSST